MGKPESGMALKFQPKRGKEKFNIAIRCNAFPISSQTFILNHAVWCVKNELRPSIHVDKKENIGLSNFKEIIDRYNIDETIFECIPDNTGPILRCMQALLHAVRHRKLDVFCRSINGFKFGLSAFKVRIYRAFSSFSESQKPDIAHAHFGHNGVTLVNARQCGMIKCPIVTSFHGYDAYIGGGHDVILSERYRELFNSGDAFIVNSQYLACTLSRLGCDSNRIHIIPNGVDISFFRPGEGGFYPSACDLRLITVGRLIGLKNQKQGIRALSELRRKGIDASYTLIGEGPEEANLRALADDQGVSQYVRFLGACSPDQIREELQTHHVFLMTSAVDELGRAETQGIVTLEAQACGLPAIVSGYGGTGETIVPDESGYIVDPTNVSEMAQKIESLLTPKVFHDFSQSARVNVVNNFDEEIVMARVFEVYNGLFESSE